MPRGVIKFFSERRGYGFIECEGNQAQDVTITSKEVFVHHSQIDGLGYRTLKEGEVVTFEIKESDGGLEAVNVRKVS